MGSSLARREAVGRRLGLCPAHARTLARLGSPDEIQRFVTALPMNFAIGRSAMSVAATLDANRAHCLESSFVAAVALWMIGMPPLLVDLGAEEGDVDHVIAVFRRGRHWGAISKSNTPYLRFRDPVYRSLRELALSYFPQYVRRRRKTLRTYSVPVDMRRHDPALWVTHDRFSHEIIDVLTAARHYPLLPRALSIALRPIDPIESRATRIKDWEPPAARRSSPPDRAPVAGRSSRSRRIAAAAPARAAG